MPSIYPRTSDLLSVLAAFMKNNLNPSRPFLLALSGGPDSLALLHLLLEYRSMQSISFSFGIAHVDHRWREESAREASILKDQAKALNIPFHLRVLDPESMEGNLEAACRVARLKFFESLCQEYGYQAVMLAHHADDQAETVLKRMLEGTCLPNLCGLRPTMQWGDLCLWRPLLNVNKKSIMDWLEVRGCSAFDDKTNLDPRFMRGRFRTSILPMLAEKFGKQINTSLIRIGSEAAEMRDYLDSVTHRTMQKVERGPFGLFLDCSTHPNGHPYEIKHLIKRFCEAGELSPSKAFLETATQIVLSMTADKRVLMGPHRLEIDRGRLFLIKTQPHPMFDKQRLAPGMYGNWYISVVSGNAPSQAEVSDGGWRALWQGECRACLPQGEYEIGLAASNTLYPGKSPISKWWTKAKAPSFLRSWIPVIWQNGVIKHEFLTADRPILAASHCQIVELKYFQLHNSWINTKSNL